MHVINVFFGGVWGLLGSPYFGVVACEYMLGYHVMDMCLYIHICALAVDRQFSLMTLGGRWPLNETY